MDGVTCIPSVGVTESMILFVQAAANNKVAARSFSSF
jgi:hypothetical protein